MSRVFQCSRLVSSHHQPRSSIRQSPAAVGQLAKLLSILYQRTVPRRGLGQKLTSRPGNKPRNLSSTQPCDHYSRRRQRPADHLFATLSTTRRPTPAAPRGEILKSACPDLLGDIKAHRVGPTQWCGLETAALSDIWGSGRTARQHRKVDRANKRRETYRKRQWRADATS